MRIFAFVLCTLLWATSGAQAAAMAAADQAGGYGDQVLEKVSKFWNPPADPVDRKVRVRVSIDGDGKVLKCEPVASSASAAMDKSACAAVREAGTFGAPPYGLPIIVAMSFWTGKPAVAAPAAAEAPAAPAAVAKADTPPTKTEQAAPAAIAKVEAPKQEPAKAPVKEPAKDAPKAQVNGKAPANAKAAPAPAAPAKAAPLKGEAADAQYVDSVMAKISPNVALPSKLADGRYTVIVMVRVDARGQITQVTLTRSGGNGELDSAIMRAVTKTAKVSAPPNKGTKDLSLTFVVQKP